MRLWQIHQNRKLLALALLVASVGATLAFQITIAAGYTDSLGWVLIPLAALVVAIVILAAARLNPRFSRWAVMGFAASVVALVIIPVVWAGATTSQNGINNTLPAAYSGTSDRMIAQLPYGDGAQGTQQNSAEAAQPARDGMMRNPDGSGTVDADLVAYLQANTDGMRWMMAVQSSHQGAAYVLETGRGVMYMGGFSGQDPVVDAESLQAYVDAGELRYVLSGSDSMPNAGRMGATDSAITTWLQESCTVVKDVTTTSGTLYDCAN
jgi:4-amino-4-deoxy-L-arabinose transferase-like glycosyltransferase